MTTENYKKIIDHYGSDAQKVKAIEELSELQKEIAKDLIGQGSIENVAEEIADVKAMTEQLQLIYGIENCDVEKIMREKILRTLYRIVLVEKEGEKNEALTPTNSKGREGIVTTEERRHLFKMELEENKEKVFEEEFPVGALISRKENPGEKHPDTEWIAVSTVWKRMKKRRREKEGSMKEKEIQIIVRAENMEDVKVLANEIREKTEEVNSLIEKLRNLTVKPVISLK